MKIMQKYENMVVIFIDILGTKNSGEFNSNKEIHEIFHEVVKSQEDIQTYTPEIQYDIKVFSFTDCAYIINSVKSEIQNNKENRVKLAHAALINVSKVIMRIMSTGRLIRGGVSYGECYYDDNGCFGEAINKAYTIESKETFFPIVKVEEELGRDVYEFQQTLEEGEINTVIIKEAFGYFLNPFLLFDYMGTFYYKGFLIRYPKFKEEIEKSIMAIEETTSDAKVIAKLYFIKKILKNYKPRFPD